MDATTNRYRLYRRPENGVYYWQDNESPRQGSLRTKNRAEAEIRLQVSEIGDSLDHSESPRHPVGVERVGRVSS